VAISSAPHTSQTLTDAPFTGPDSYHLADHLCCPFMNCPQTPTPRRYIGRVVSPIHGGIGWSNESPEPTKFREAPAVRPAVLGELIKVQPGALRRAVPRLSEETY